MAQVEGCAETASTHLPTLEQWLDNETITPNLYNQLTKEKPPYNVQLLLLMSENDIRELKNDFQNVKTTEILQLVNALSKIPQSKISRDINNSTKQQKIIYLTPKQHSTINHLRQNLIEISSKLESVTNLSKSTARQLDTNELLIDTAFDELIKQLNKRRLESKNEMKKVFNERREMLAKQESRLKTLYQNTLDIQNDYERFIQTTCLDVQLTKNSSLNEKKNEIDFRIDENNSNVSSTLRLVGELLNEIDNNNDCNIKMCESKECEQIISNLIAFECNRLNDVSSFTFVPHTCCHDVIVTNDGLTCKVAGDGKSVFFGECCIPVGRSKFSLIINHGDYVGIGFVPKLCDKSLDYYHFQDDKDCWLLWNRRGGLYCKGNRTEDNIRFAKNDKVSIVTQMFDGNKKDTSQVVVVNETTGKKTSHKKHDTSIAYDILFEGINNYSAWFAILTMIDANVGTNIQPIQTLVS